MIFPAFLASVGEEVKTKKQLQSLIFALSGFPCYLGLRIRIRPCGFDSPLLSWLLQTAMGNSGNPKKVRKPILRAIALTAAIIKALSRNFVPLDFVQMNGTCYNVTCSNRAIDQEIGPIDLSRLECY